MRERPARDPRVVEFRARVRAWAERLDVQVRSVTVRPMSRKWASCSTAGRLTFSTEVPAFDGPLQDYLIVHELLHLRVPNHGRLWKSLMRAHLGDWERQDARPAARAVQGAGGVAGAHARHYSPAMRDTTADALAVADDAVRRTAPVERMRQALAHSEAMREFALAGLRARYPDLPTIALVELMLGVRLVRSPGARP